MAARLDESINFDDFDGDGFDPITDSDMFPQSPFRGIILGASNAGKTNFLMNLIRFFVVDRVLCVAGTLAEGKYKLLREICDAEAERREKEIAEILEAHKKEQIRKQRKLPPPQTPRPFEIMFLTPDEISELPDPDVLAEDPDIKHIRTLAIFDDIAHLKEKELKPVSMIFLMGRKAGITAFWLTQRLDSLPPLIRNNITWKVIFPVSNAALLAHIAQNSPFTPVQLAAIMKYADAQKRGISNMLIFDEKKPTSQQWRLGINLDEFIPQESRLIDKWIAEHRVE